MATQKITLKRVIDDNQNTDVLYPTTTLDQIFTVDSDGDITSTNLSTYLGDTYVAQTALGANSGVATLDSNGTLTPAQIPSSLIGGMNFSGTISLSSNKDADDLISAGMTTVGDYLIVTASGNIVSDAGTDPKVASLSVEAPGDEGDSSLPVTLEAGDWIVLTDKTGSTYTVAIINNTYRDASTSAKGIVQLSNATTTAGTTSEVITENALGNIVIADATDVSDGTSRADKIAAAEHNHDTAYEPKRSTSGTAYNKDFGTGNTDVARGDHDHDSRYLQLSGGTLTADITMQYDGDTSANRGSHAVRFQGYSTAGGGGTFDRYMSITSGGELQYGSALSPKKVYVIESTSLGRTFYNTTTGAVEGDFIIDVD